MNGRTEEDEVETLAYVCSHVFENTKPVLLVSRADDDWQLLCGEMHPDADKPYVVGLEHLLERDPSLKDVMDLPPEWEAERKAVGAPWLRTKLDPDGQ